MKVKSDSSAQIMYIKDTGEYKIIVDTGNIIYVFDTPADATLEQLTDYKSTGDLEKDAIAKAGIYTTTSKEFNSGFFKNDKLVSVPLAVNQITQSVADDAQDVLKNFFDTQKTISETYGQSNQLWTDDEYLSQIAILSARFDGDLEAAQDAFEKTPAYGSILQRLGLSQARLNAEKMLKTDPIGFQNVRNENINYLNGIVSASGGDIPDTAVFYLGDLVAKGLMSLEEAKRQISGATDMYSPYRERLDAGFKNALGGGNVKVTTAGEDTVQNLLDRYLPKNLHRSINIAEEAGNIRSNPNYQQSFINKLKKQRYAIYNMYDEDIDWNIILNSKKQAAKNVLGVELKEDDIALDAIIRMNDSTKEQEYLRELGLERGYNKVKNDLTKAMMATFGSGVVQSRSYVG
jgi:hypothetical protein